MPKYLPLLAALLTTQVNSPADVVINEVFYHAPDDIDDLEWVELHNTSDQTVDLSGWSLSKGIRFRFAPGTNIDPHGFLVVCKDVKLFGEFYDATAIGGFQQSLGNETDTLELSDAQGNRVDGVTYQDHAPWPVASDGYSASLERISPAGASESATNWAASRMPDEIVPAGTPGKRNDAYSAAVPPVVSNVRMVPLHPAPNHAMRVSADVAESNGLESVELLYRIVQSGSIGEEQSVPMSNSGDGQHAGEIPGQSAGCLVRYRIRAVDRAGTVRFHPASTALRPAESVYVMQELSPANIPFGFIIHTRQEDVDAAERFWRGSLEGGGPFGGGPRANAQQMLAFGLDIESPWFELTVNQSLDDQLLEQLRTLFRQQDARRNALISDVLGAKDPTAELKSLPARLQRFQQETVQHVTAALPKENVSQFQKWASQNQGQPGPEQFLKQMVKIEGLWLALCMRFDVSEQQTQGLRHVLQAAEKERGKQMPMLQKLMKGEGSFEELQAALGNVQQQLWNDLKPQLSFRQNRFARKWYREQASPIRPQLGETPPQPPRGRSAFVFVDHETLQPKVFDFINISQRSAGYKIRFHKDRPLNQMTTANIIFEYNDRFVLAEPLAFELYRQVGNAACQTEFVRLWIDGHLLGYHLMFEQPNRAFLRRNKLNADGNLYKLVWYGQGIEGQHEKKTHPDRGHEDLLEAVRLLESASGDEQWPIIQQHFNVPQMVNYFAVNMCLSHWDGFFNNFFAYHDVGGTKKWELYPWDQDKTWGYYDGIAADDVFVDMPLTFGMEGDLPPGGGPAHMRMGSWWRPGGFFSKPLLANPEFRKQFLRRTREILDTVYCEESFFPVIDALADRLRPEIPIRAAVVMEDKDKAMKRFDDNIRSLKTHLAKRREFLLQQDELKEAKQ